MMAQGGTHPRRKRPGRSATSAAMLSAQDLEIKAFNLRKEGKQYHEIAAELGCSMSSAHRAVTRLFVRTREECAEDIESLRQLEVARCDAYLDKLKVRINDGEPNAIATALRVGERRAKLLGLDAPERHEIDVSAVRGLPGYQELQRITMRYIAELPSERQDAFRAEVRALMRGETPALPAVTVQVVDERAGTAQRGDDGSEESDRI